MTYSLRKKIIDCKHQSICIVPHFLSLLVVPNLHPGKPIRESRLPNKYILLPHSMAPSSVYKGGKNTHTDEKPIFSFSFPAWLELA